MVRTFRGQSVHKVDSKGRVSIPAAFRRVLEAGDPSFEQTGVAELVIVFGDERRDFLECYSLDAIAEIDRKIKKMPRGNPRRRALQRLYNGQSHQTAIDETGRLVLPAMLREKIGLDGEAFFIGNGDTFEIWKPSAFDASIDLGMDDPDFDPQADPSIYLDGDEDEEF